jgi:hypothetical protein
MHGTVITAGGIIHVLREIQEAPGGALNILVNPRDDEARGGVGIRTVRSGMTPLDRVATVKSAAARGLVAAEPSVADEHGNRFQLCSLTQLGEDVLDGAVEIPALPNASAQAQDSELGLSGTFKRAARAQARHDRQEGQQ